MGAYSQLRTTDAGVLAFATKPDKLFLVKLENGLTSLFYLMCLQ